MTRHGLALALSVLVSGCTERLIRDGGLCGDGVLAAGDACFTADDVLQFSPDDLEGIAIRADDFSGDGHVDVLVMGRDRTGGAAGRTLLGDGTGSLRPAVDARVTGCSAHPVPGRVDDDRATDLLADECGNGMWLYTGQADGVFAGPETIDVGAGTRTSALVDLDGRGWSHVVVLGSAADDSAVLVDARRPSEQPPIVVPVPMARFDYDPKGYSLAGVGGRGTLTAFLVDPDGARGLLVERDPFGASPEESIVYEGLTIDLASVRDYDGDGDDELLVHVREQAELVLHELDDGVPAAEGASTDISEVGAGGRLPADIDGDGRLDLVMSQAGGTSLWIWLGQEGGTFEAAAEVPFGIAIEQYAAADLDEDGALDLIVGPDDRQGVTIRLADP